MSESIDGTFNTVTSKFLPPTSALPNIKELRSTSPANLQKAVDYLRLLYLPEVRGSRRRRRDGLKEDGLSPSSKPMGPGSAHDVDIRLIRSDAFERAFAIRWLTALNKVLTEYDANFDEDCAQGDINCQEHQILIDRAASLLASCSGASAIGTISRQFAFLPLGGQEHHSVSIVLTDVPLINADYGSVGAQTWGGACVLSEMLVEDPSSFGLAVPVESFQQHTLRILELGSGTGLVGLTISKLFQQSASRLRNDDDYSIPSVSNVEIVLTDFHPVVLENLRRNVEANFGRSNAEEESEGLDVDVKVRRLDWESVYRAQKDESLGAQGQDAEDTDMGGPFDLIYGADIIYEAEHALWVRACLENMLAPSSSACFHLIIPLRSTHTKESITIEKTFARGSLLKSNDVLPVDHAVNSDSEPASPGRNLVILSEEKIICDALPDGEAGKASYDGADEVVYMYYKIGWECLPSS